MRLAEATGKKKKRQYLSTERDNSWCGGGLGKNKVRAQTGQAERLSPTLRKKLIFPFPFQVVIVWLAVD